MSVAVEHEVGGVNRVGHTFGSSHTEDADLGFNVFVVGSMP